MFNQNKKLHKQLEQIKDLLGIEEDPVGNLGFDKEGPMAKLLELTEKHIAEDYFKDCPCCDGEKYILKSESKKFEKLERYVFNTFIEEKYTTKENYKLHKSRIEAWEKEVKEYRKNESK